MTTLAMPFMGQLFVPVNNGASAEARRIQERFVETLGSYRTVARQKAFSDLFKAFWEAEDAEAARASWATFAVAYRFLSALPAMLPTPEVGVDPDGEVNFEWIKSKDTMFTVAIGAEGILNFAGLFGGRAKSHGREDFRDEIPLSVVQNIRRVGLEPD